MKKEVKDLFSFNSTEKNGILVLLVILLIVVIAPGIYSRFSHNTSWKIENASAGLNEISIAEAKHHDIKKSAHTVTSEIKSEIPKLTPFDPNILSEDEWKELGLKGKQIHTIRNYLSKGGKFRTREDFGKIYGISREDYARLSPFIQISDVTKPKEAEKEQFHQKQYRKTEIVKLDVNTADSISLLEVRGIGPSFAKRIIKYRDLLGGFYSVEQLKEVYGIDSLKFNLIAPQLGVLTPPFRKYNLNKVSLAELRKNPYFDYTTAKAIIDRRILKGPYSDLDQLRELMVTPETVLRILPYLEL
ncbi:MAG: helix-hairpin-helix domain-containing protein [Bacteroidales bacterium]|nr:helix-hairpin-helix domain-containing protein [Bacteroidales bacterium]